ncbi:MULTISPECIES: branched-chain amino acid transport system II carrier protein [unclassified Staphylococcus]|uniref:branched-chain amino acid-like transporter carrier protein BrnQ3 n=1 Tax=unclassified Staphylococcus TaxID=91994 RepID=UPI0021D3CFF3|nr:MULTISPECIES: branched-chain amino acid transport system II carrier protein [unclassified Staphylococcus]UXR70840.1 branched-chain amino acid transport system II carrier protein [Staphylococcus sp. IVB6240]UXR73070.1 branched-chain amino acid transport system II carrier protein [Staphylococcus sp. IVB6238]UXR77283.1 branched-chain amino acid transport system II carrier protein [Staphylococcus sp. IVB6233]UXR79569.1 branched-chain amino acid transport system II carrier protein [Staphylococcus
MNKNTLVIGFMLFAIFFGAGNLIFPPSLGLESGQYFWPSIIAFVITGIGLPLLGVVVGALDKEGYIGAINKIHPAFSVVFLVVIYLTIGPLFAIPRTASTSFEMTITPIINSSSPLWLFVFSVIYFIVVLYLCFNPGKIVDRIGAILTPLLLITILAMIVKGFIDFGGNPSSSADPEVYKSNISGFTKGFTEGYLTMDAIAAIAFSMIVVNAVKATGIRTADQIFKQTALSAIIATAALAFIYISLGFIGNHMIISEETMKQLTENNQNIGAHLLITIAATGYGAFGKYLLGIIVALACLTTACGLVVAVSEYFHSILPKLSYKTYVIIFTLISFVLSNLGLNSVIQLSIPVLLIIYPVAITTVLLILIARFVPTRRITQQITVAVVALESILSVFNTNGWIKMPFIESLPFHEYSLEWFPIAVITLLIAYAIGAFVKSSNIIVYEKE